MHNYINYLIAMHAKQDFTSLHKRFLKRNLADVGPELANVMLQPQTRYMASSMTEFKVRFGKSKTSVNMLLVSAWILNYCRIISTGLKYIIKISFNLIIGIAASFLLALIIYLSTWSLLTNSLFILQACFLLAQPAALGQSLGTCHLLVHWSMTYYAQPAVSSLPTNCNHSII